MESEARPQQQSKQVCAFFLRVGTCSFGDSCKFAHPYDKLPEFEFNTQGLPLRQGEPECEFFTKHGCCSFGRACKFNHPELPADWRPPSRPVPVPIKTIKAPQATRAGGKSQTMTGRGQSPVAPKHGPQPAPSRPAPSAPPLATMYPGLPPHFSNPFAGVPVSPMHMPMYTPPFGSPAPPGMVGLYTFGSMPQPVAYGPGGQWVPYMGMVQSMSCDTLQQPSPGMWPEQQPMFRSNSNDPSQGPARRCLRQASTESLKSDPGTRGQQTAHKPSPAHPPSPEGPQTEEPAGTGVFRPNVPIGGRQRRHGRRGPTPRWQPTGATAVPSTPNTMSASANESGGSWQNSGPCPTDEA